MTHKENSLVPSFMSEDELLKHTQLTTSNKKVLKKTCDLYLQKVKDLPDHIGWERRQSDGLKAVKSLMREKKIIEAKFEKIEESVNTMCRDVEALRPQSIEKQNEVLQASQELENLKESLQTIQKECDGQRNNMKKSYNAHIIAKDIYKKYLVSHIRYLTSDEKDIFVFTFGTTKGSVIDEVLPSSSAKFAYCPKECTWKLLETNPTLQGHKQLCDKLESSQDIHGLIAHLREQFQKICT